MIRTLFGSVMMISLVITSSKIPENMLKIKETAGLLIEKHQLYFRHKEEGISILKRIETETTLIDESAGTWQPNVGSDVTNELLGNSEVLELSSFSKTVPLLGGGATIVVGESLGSSVIGFGTGLAGLGIGVAAETIKKGLKGKGYTLLDSDFIGPGLQSPSVQLKMPRIPKFGSTWNIIQKVYILLRK
ncbi:hypothetical protein AVEN_191357-1 [Araneus ventricosus]|uniref:DUF4781 domain-containing protein n=1 Tax=Araneus ventricosus TaxID=182803 RepID=A0A4Y2TA99_ARAVE|nr:hypothetical protein AVEN_191357-1 [Araneus ventricosus]